MPIMRQRKRLAFLLLFASLLGCTQSYRPSTTSETKNDTATETGLPFSVGRKAVQLLPFPMRMSKLRSVVGSDDATLYKEIEDRKGELGGFDYASGVRQELSWLESRMTSWTKGLRPICTSEIMRSKYSWTGGLRKFFVAAYGREPSGHDLEMVSRVDSQGASAGEKFEILCTAVLSSLEFLTL
jgi:hypothetical protein